MPAEKLSALIHRLRPSLYSTLLKSAGINDPSTTTTTSNKSDQVEAIISYCSHAGITKFVSNMPENLFANFVQECKLSKQSKEQMVSTLTRSTLPPLLAATTKGLLVKIVEYLDFDTDAEQEQVLADDICDEILLSGTTQMVSTWNHAELEHACKDLKLVATGTVDDLRDRVLNLAFPGLLSDEEEAKAMVPKYIASPKKPKKQSSEDTDTTTAAKRTKEEIVASRKAIALGITFDDLFQDYWAEELKDYCRLRGIVCNANKSATIRQILAHLQDPSDTGHKSKKRKKRSSLGGKAKKQKTE